MAGGDTSPQIKDGFSPLEQVALRAIRRYGESSPSTGDGESMLTMVDMANEVIDDLLVHPYWPEGVTIPYYESQFEARDIPDNLLQSGLLAKIAIDLQSKKAPAYTNAYISRMNSILYRMKYGPAPARPEMTVVDQARFK